MSFGRVQVVSCLRSVAWIALFVVLAGCNVSIEPGQQLAGQICYRDGDCLEGLFCSGRICLPSGAASTVLGQPSPDLGLSPDQQVSPDAGACELGEQRCIGETIYELCVESDAGFVFERRACSDGAFCQEGECTTDLPCEDADGEPAELSLFVWHWTEIHSMYDEYGGGQKLMKQM